MSRCHHAIAVVLTSLLLGSAPAAAVLIDSIDGDANVVGTAPIPEIFHHVGVCGGASAVYLGNGWVLTAKHVGAGSVELGGVLHQAVPGSAIQLARDFGSGLADLLVFRIVTDPGLGEAALASREAWLEEPVFLVGAGVDRGAQSVWNGLYGWLWASGSSMRWGTNYVSEVARNIPNGVAVTYSFATTFDAFLPTPHEANGTAGDSGGAVIAHRFGGWELVGLMHAITTLPGQAPGTTFPGNRTYSADLGAFRAQLDALTSERACSDGRDDDGDGWIDYPQDPGCASPDDAFETDAALACDDGFDDDGDGRVDALEDLGCGGDPLAPSEDPECEDGVDNDGDGLIDWDGGPGGERADPNCRRQPWRDGESPGPGGP